MIGMVLCGGKGTRLRPLTETVPKPLLELREGYTILDRQLFDLATAGAERIVLLTGYLSERIEEHVGKKAFGVPVEYAVEAEPLGTLNAIRLGGEVARCEGEAVVVRNGDVIADLGIGRMADAASPELCDISMYVTRMRSPFGIVELGDRLVRSFREKPLLDAYINGGVYVFPRFDPAVFGPHATGNIERTVFPEVARAGRLAYYREEGVFWLAVDTAKELEEARKEYEGRTDKPWGYEKVLVSTEKYLTKELFIREGFRTSLHRHEQKDETMYVISGSGYVEFKDGGRVQLARNDSVRITPGRVHSIVATENLVLHEFSTPHPDDTVREKDFYAARAERPCGPGAKAGRAGKGAARRGRR